MSVFNICTCYSRDFDHELVKINFQRKSIFKKRKLNVFACFALKLRLINH